MRRIAAVTLVLVGFLASGTGGASGAERQKGIHVVVYRYVGSAVTVKTERCEVIVRRPDGSIQFRAMTKDDGTISIPLDVTQLGLGYQLEARVVIGDGLYEGCFVSVSPRNVLYKIVLPPDLIID